MSLIKQIEDLKSKWNAWADSKNKNVDQKVRRIAYRHFAAVMCLDAIKKLLKKDK